MRQIQLPSLATALGAALRSGGVDAMVAAYRAWKSAPATAGQFTELEVNAFAYQLVGSEQLSAALRLFELNVESYPNSWNAYDSLAEAYARSGNVERAIEFYEESLELNPANQNGKAMLEAAVGLEIRVRSGCVVHSSSSAPRTRFTFPRRFIHGRRY